MITCLYCSQELVPGVLHECVEGKGKIPQALAAAHVVMEPLQLDLFDEQDKNEG